jgi:hypothetical protein
VNSINGAEPAVAVHEPRFRLLVSPVEPASATHVGAEVDPSVNPTFTVTEAPLLKPAREPPASPTMLNSDSFQTEAISSLLSLPVRENASLPLIGVLFAAPREMKKTSAFSASHTAATSVTPARVARRASVRVD